MRWATPLEKPRPTTAVSDSLLTTAAPILRSCFRTAAQKEDDQLVKSFGEWMEIAAARGLVVIVRARLSAAVSTATDLPCNLVIVGLVYQTQRPQFHCWAPLVNRCWMASTI